MTKSTDRGIDRQSTDPGTESTHTEKHRQNPDRQHLLNEIAEQEARLVDLQKEQRRTKEALARLRAELAEAERTIDEDRPNTTVRESKPQHVTIPSTPGDKIALFRSLFRGREDVYPKLWESQKTGRKGYTPACANEWVAGLCDKRRVKCGECPNRDLLPVTDQVVRDHLQGRHVIGAYPMLTDETCWFLAADFDKASWEEDIAAFGETCRSMGVPVAIERSRSSNGAHAWFLFSEPVLAREARRMGCYLLTETMERRHQLGLSSYDRLFPNQDTMPQGGFGNLIALPLQHGPRQAGNSVFLDEQLRPHDDQWAFLAAVRRLPPEDVLRIAAEASRTGRVIGVRFVPPEDETDREPWNRPPSRRPRYRPIEAPLPPQVRAVLAQRLFVEKTGLPSAMVNRMRRIAAFQNPEFYKKQGMRLSTALTPRVIFCAEEEVEHVALPRGCFTDLRELLEEHDSQLVVEDRRTDGQPLDVRFEGTLTDEQQKAADVFEGEDMGVLVAPPGTGKTVIGIHLIAKRARNTLVLVHRQQLLDQWRSQIAMFLGLELSKIGQIGGGKRKPTGQIDVAMIQSLVRRGDVADLIAEYGHVIVDECHHIPAPSFERLLGEAHARFVTGLTATPRRRDGHHPITEMQLGPVRYTVDQRKLAASRPFEQKLVLRHTNFRYETEQERPPIQDVYRAMVDDPGRNQLLLDDIIQALEQGRSPIVLTERTAHLAYLKEQLQGFARNIAVLRGGRTSKQRRVALEELAAVPDDEERLILATGRFIGEGFDDDRLDTLFLVMPISWKGTLIQYTGRLHRLHPAKREVRIYDYIDRHVPMLARMANKRLRGYRSIGYEVVDSDLENALERPVPSAEDDERFDGDAVIEWDLEALRALEWDE